MTDNFKKNPQIWNKIGQTLDEIGQNLDKVSFYTAF